MSRGFREQEKPVRKMIDDEEGKEGGRR